MDAKRLAAIGFCFGGTTVLELAYSGADVRGVVSFHGGLSSPTPGDARNIKAKVLVLHGADDPFVPAAELAALSDEGALAAAEALLTIGEFAGVGPSRRSSSLTSGPRAWSPPSRPRPPK